MIRTALLLVRDVLHLVALIYSSHTSLAAENLFLRKQLLLRRAEGAAAPPG
jgi:hypothetical protein